MDTLDVGTILSTKQDKVVKMFKHAEKKYKTPPSKKIRQFVNTIMMTRKDDHWSYYECLILKLLIIPIILTHTG